MSKDKRSVRNLKGRTLPCTTTYFFVSVCFFLLPFPSHNSCVLHPFFPQALLNHKTTNVNIEGRNKYTPLHSAAHLEHRSALEICQKLVSITWITRCMLIKHTRPIDNLPAPTKKVWHENLGESRLFKYFVRQFVLNRMEQGSTHCEIKRLT